MSQGTRGSSLTSPVRPPDERKGRCITKQACFVATLDHVDPLALAGCHTWLPAAQPVWYTRSSPKLERAEDEATLGGRI